MLLGLIAMQNIKSFAVYCYRCSVVCVFVCVSVDHNRQPIEKRLNQLRRNLDYGRGCVQETMY